MVPRLRSPVSWESDETTVLFNPSDPRIDPGSACSRIAGVRRLPAHVWLASSGSEESSPDVVKWVALSHESLLASATAVNRHLGEWARGGWIHALPVFHVGGLGIFARAHAAGAPVFEGLEGEPRRWNPELFHRRASECAASLASLVPAQVHDLVRLDLEAPRTLRAVVVGGDALTERLRRAARTRGWNVLPSYGCTECCSQIATAARDGVDPALVPLRHLEIRSEPDGRLAFRGAAVLTGLARVPPSGEPTWLDPRRDGWFVGDDLGELVEGRLVLRGRVSDRIKIGGEMTDVASLARRFEDAARDAGLSADAAVVAVPDDRLGMAVHAVIAANEGSEEDRRLADALARLSETIAPFERPRRIHYVERIPRSPLGKLLRAELLRRLLG